MGRRSLVPVENTAMVAGSSDWAAWLDSYEGLPAPAAPEAAATSSKPLHDWLHRAGVIVPGLALAAVLALAAHALADLVGRLLLGFEKSPVSSIPVAVLLGVILRNSAGIPKVYEAGLKTCVRSLLRLGIVLLGLRLSLTAAGAIGLAGLPIIVSCIAAALLAVTLLSRALGLSARQGQLIAVGTGICGVSAIAAAAPAVDATEDEVSYSVACVTLFGMLAMFSYPFLAFWLLDGNHRLVGYLLGTSIHDTAQVTGAALMYSQQFRGPEALDVATVTKLIRNTAMVILIPVVGFLARRRGAGAAAYRWTSAIPLFVVVYIALASLRSVGDLGAKAFGVLSRGDWQQFLAGADRGAGWLLAAAMAAIGLGTEFSRIRRLGWRPMAAGFAGALIVGGVSLLLLTWNPPLE